MAAVAATLRENGTHKHTTSSKLESQAATAALYVTNQQQPKTGQEYLNKHHRLSSAGAAASLRYANPQDLPSYPTSGLKSNDSAAGAAATSGWANRKQFEHWKPDPSASAASAALLAKDYKMSPSWQPEASSSGAKAALMAHRDKDAGKVEISQPEASSPWGNFAATQAFKKYGSGNLSPQVDYGYTELGRKGSLMAATGAMKSGRRRAESSPLVIPVESYPDEHNATYNAMSAANLAHKQKNKGDLPPEGGSTPYTNMAREMFSSHPPVSIEVQEKNRKDTLHASAVAMAQGMYKMQQKQLEASTNAQSQRGAAAASHGRTASMPSESTEAEPMRFNNLQEAAHKLAQERLAKLHDEHAINREYRDYYGSSKQPSKLSIRGRARRRASSDGKLYEDREQSDKIRAQMSIFSQNVQQIDAKKQREDREALLAAAQRNVTQTLHGMDEKVFAETGKSAPGRSAPSKIYGWDVGSEAYAAAQAKSDTRTENYGKVNIGGGKYVDQAAIDSVALRNVQPVLDDINQKAEAERERKAALKADQETETRKAADKKQREKETKEINKKLKQQDKDEEKMRKADEKAAKKEEDRLAKERRKSLKSEAVVAPEVTPAKSEPETEAEPVANPELAIQPPAATSAPVETLAERREVVSTPAPIRASMEDQSSLRMREAADAANGDEVTPLSPSPTTSPGKVKNWLKNKFAKRGGKGSNTLTPAENEKSSEKGFIGGTALTGATINDHDSTGSLSMRNVALAGKGKQVDPNAVQSEDERIGRQATRTSKVSSLESGSEFQEARDNFDDALEPPQPQFPVEKAHSPARDSKFIEAI